MKESMTQQHGLGCGIACIAFISNTKYEAIFNKVSIKKVTNNGLSCKEVVLLLNVLGYSYEYKYIKPRLRKNIYKDGTLVFIKRSKKYPYGHYLARYKGEWMDPWINFPIDQDLVNAKSGFRERLPGKAIYLISPL